MENRKAEPGGRADNRHRLREILAVLARHGILRGLTPVKLRLIIQDLGPTFVKLGQILSMRQDMLPAEYCQELTLLRADVSPMPFGEVKEVVEAEYGVPMKSLFLSFEETPLGSASIAQVHAAVLRGRQRGRRQGTAAGGAGHHGEGHRPPSPGGGHPATGGRHRRGYRLPHGAR